MLIKRPVGVHEDSKTGKSKINEVLYMIGLIFQFSMIYWKITAKIIDLRFNII